MIRIHINKLIITEKKGTSTLEFGEKWRGIMINYNKLWKLLIDKGINKKKLIEITGVSSSYIAKLTKGENVTTDVLCKICKALECDFFRYYGIHP